MKKRFKTIGILGGIGPSASANMYVRIINYMQQNYDAWDDADFPKVMVYSTALSGFDENGIENPSLVAADLVRAVKKLEAMGSDLIVVACNTVHHFDKQMDAALAIPLIHMIGEACNEVKDQGIKKVGIVSSQSTRDLKLYSDRLKAINIAPIVTTDDEQEVVNSVIQAVMAGKQDNSSKIQLNNVFERMQAAGAEAILLGCTEIPLAISQQDSTVNLIDANHVIVKQAVELAIE